jgi:hypothetical protein
MRIYTQAHGCKRFRLQFPCESINKDQICSVTPNIGVAFYMHIHANLYEYARTHVKYPYMESCKKQAVSEPNELKFKADSMRKHANPCDSMSNISAYMRNHVD